MSWTTHPWEAIYREEGRRYNEPFPGFADVASELRSLGCRKVLDIGCGNGRHVLGLAREGFEVCGLDISLTALRLTREWLEEERLEADTVHADMRQPLPFSDGSFSGVFSTQVIHHARIAEIRRTIAEIRRVLVPGGAAFVTVSGHRDEGTEFEEIEPGTFVPLTGDERGLPHHVFTREEVASEFRMFETVCEWDFADGKVLATLATRPMQGA